MKNSPVTRCQRRSRRRTGGVYLAVLGTALIASALALSALGLQRIQNRQLTASCFIRQAQLNAEAAIELAQLEIEQNSSWRSDRDGQSYLFVDRSLGNGSSCSLQAIDSSADVSDIADRPIELWGSGEHATPAGVAAQIDALQQARVILDPRREPHDCLKPSGSALPDSWQAIVNYYSNPTNATQIQLTSLPNRTKASGAQLDDRSFALNVSLTSSDTYWYDADTLAPAEFATAAVERRTNIGSPVHAHCLRIERGSRRAGPANRLQASLLKPNTQYRVDIDLYAPNGNWFQSYLICRTGASYQLVAGSTTSISWFEGFNWQTRSFTVTTPAWATRPQDIYFALNSDPSGGDGTFYVDNIDFYETDARFIYQTVLGTSVQNPRGLYWIDCQGTTKLVIERSRIFGTLLVLNPGPGSCIDYGPIHISPAVGGYPTLLVSNTNGNAFSIRSTSDPTSDPADDSLTETENGISFNPNGAPHRTHGTDGDQSDAYESEIRGLVAVSGSLNYANSPTIRGKVVAGSVSGSANSEYYPDSLINPPPPLDGFYSYRYDRRPSSVRKVVVP